MKKVEENYLDEQLVGVKNKGLLDFRTTELPTWCPGCGYFGITHAIVQSFQRLGIKNENICTISGIGCAGRFPVFMNSYGFHTLHGRSIPVATGVKLARDDLTVIAVAGDGDALGIGGGHLPHVARKNINVTLFLFDNGIYGLTKGQSSSTTPRGQITSSHNKGNPDTPLKPVSLALAHDASFVARGFAGDVEGMIDIFKKAIEHDGFSFVHIVSPCVTFDKVNFTWDNLKKQFISIPANHDLTDHISAVRLAEDSRRFLGIFYHDKERLSYREYFKQQHGI